MPVYAYSTMLYLSLPPVKALERIMSKGLDAEFSYDNFVVYGGKSVEDKYISDVLNRLSDFVDRVKTVHMPYDEMEPQIALSEPGLRRYSKWMDLAYRLSTKVVVVHTLKISTKFQNAFELNAEFLRTLLREAVDRGILIAVENRLEKNLFGSKPSDLIKIVEELGEGIGICLDVGHAHINKNIESFLSLGKHIVAIHVHDNDGFKDLHKPPSSGSIKWSLIEDWITRSRFKGVVVFEVLCRDNVNVCDSVVEQIRSKPIANL